ncbi:hypothetical protein SESBI_44608 [Sesbania bispinosa]|nr:hypothetical protein SESBI_44608 [Sesbania bispinosa]
MDIELNSGTDHNPIGVGVQHMSNLYSVDGLNAQFAFGPDTYHANLSRAVDVVGVHLDVTKTQNEGRDNIVFTNCDSNGIGVFQDLGEHINLTEARVEQRDHSDLLLVSSRLCEVPITMAEDLEVGCLNNKVSNKITKSGSVKKKERKAREVESSESTSE